MVAVNRDFEETDHLSSVLSSLKSHPWKVTLSLGTTLTRNYICTAVPLSLIICG